SDHDRVAVLANLTQHADARDVDERLRRREAQLHQRQQRVPAREHLRLLAARLEQLHRLVDARRTAQRELGRDHDAPPWPKPQTRSGWSGMSMWSTPSASQTEFTTAALAAIVPASPMPLTPSGLTGVGVTVRSSSNAGSSAALGIM